MSPPPHKFDSIFCEMHENLSLLGLNHSLYPSIPIPLGPNFHSNMTGVWHLFFLFRFLICWNKFLTLDFWRIQAGDVDTIRQLIHQGANLNEPSDYDGKTSLHLACAEGHVEVVQLLLKNGASAYVRDRRGRTPLFEAIRWVSKKLMVWDFEIDWFKMCIERQVTSSGYRAQCF